MFGVQCVSVDGDTVTCRDPKLPIGLQEFDVKWTDSAKERPSHRIGQRHAQHRQSKDVKEAVARAANGQTERMEDVREVMAGESASASSAQPQVQRMDVDASSRKRGAVELNKRLRKRPRVDENDQLAGEIEEEVEEIEQEVEEIEGEAEIAKDVVTKVQSVVVSMPDSVIVVESEIAEAVDEVYENQGVLNSLSAIQVVCHGILSK